MNAYLISAISFGAMTLAGSVSIAYQIYQMTIIDAKARGFKHPRFWGIFNTDSNNYLLYLIVRCRYPKEKLSEKALRKMNHYKKAAGISIIFTCIGGIGLFLSLFLGN